MLYVNAEDQLKLNAHRTLLPVCQPFFPIYRVEYALRGVMICLDVSLEQQSFADHCKKSFMNGVIGVLGLVEREGPIYNCSIGNGGLK